LQQHAWRQSRQPRQLQQHKQRLKLLPLLPLLLPRSPRQLRHKQRSRLPARLLLQQLWLMQRQVMLLLLLQRGQCAGCELVDWLGRCRDRRGTLQQAVQLQTWQQHSSSCSTSCSSSSRVGMAPQRQQQQQQQEMWAWGALAPHTIASRC
jgi:hypothetical protein